MSTSIFGNEAKIEYQLTLHGHYSDLYFSVFLLLLLLLLLCAVFFVLYVYQALDKVVERIDFDNESLRCYACCQFSIKRTVNTYNPAVIPDPKRPEETCL